MNASFKEKSVWLTFIAMVVTFGNYFARVWFFPDLVENPIGLFFIVMMIFIVITIFLHIGLAVGQRQESSDDRDQRVSGKAYRNSHFAFVTMLVMGIGILMFVDFGSEMTAFNLMLFSVVVGELVYMGSQLVYYRIGA